MSKKKTFVSLSLPSSSLFFIFIVSFSSDIDFFDHIFTLFYSLDHFTRCFVPKGSKDVANASRNDAFLLFIL